jgi:hypothetical protein
LGLAVSAALTLILDVSAAMNQSTQIVGQAVSVERVVEYSKIRPEEEASPIISGKVMFRNQKINLRSRARADYFCLKHIGKYFHLL